MGVVQLNSELNLKYPESFAVMTDEELKKHKFYEDAPGFCISDEGGHMVVSFSWRQANPFVVMVVGTKDVARNMEAKVRKPMSRFGYRLEEFMMREVGGKQADGYRYSYEVQGTGMMGESLSVKSGSNFYYIHSYFRAALREESLKVLDEMFGAVTWS